MAPGGTPSGLCDGERELGVQVLLERDQRGVDVLLDDLRELLLRAARGRGRVRDADHGPVVARRDHPDRPGRHVAAVARVDGGDGHLAGRHFTVSARGDADHGRRPAGRPTRRSRTPVPPVVRTMRALRDGVGRGRVAVRPADAAGGPRLLDPLAGGLEVARDLDRDLDRLGRDDAGPSRSTAVAAGSAVTVSETGPTGSIRGVTVISADGRTNDRGDAARRRPRAARIRTATIAPAHGPASPGFADGDLAAPAHDLVELRLLAGSAPDLPARRPPPRPAASADDPPRPSPARGRGASAGRPRRRPWRAVAPAAADGGRGRSGGSPRRRPGPASRAASYSPTEANTGQARRGGQRPRRGVRRHDVEPSAVRPAPRARAAGS